MPYSDLLVNTYSPLATGLLHHHHVSYPCGLNDGPDWP